MKKMQKTGRLPSPLGFLQFEKKVISKEGLGNRLWERNFKKFRIIVAAMQCGGGFKS